MTYDLGIIEETIDNGLLLIADGSISAGRYRVRIALEAGGLSEKEAELLAGAAMHLLVQWESLDE